MFLGIYLVFTSLQAVAYRGILKDKPVNSSRSPGVKEMNDGTVKIVLKLSNNPFIEVDLLETYFLKSVFVTGRMDGYSDSIKFSKLGVSNLGSKLITCGLQSTKEFTTQKQMWATMEFACLHASRVRYLKFWKEMRSTIGPVILDADGIRAPLPGLGFILCETSFQKVENSTSVSASSMIHCAQLCRVSFCRVLSYSSQLKPNCLLSDYALTVEDPSWDSWTDINC